jgi:hypothetical protein
MPSPDSERLTVKLKGWARALYIFWYLAFFGLVPSLIALTLHDNGSTAAAVAIWTVTFIVEATLAVRVLLIRVEISRSEVAVVNLFRRTHLPQGSIVEVTRKRTGPLGGFLNGSEEVIGLATPTRTVPIAATYSSPKRRELVEQALIGRPGTKHYVAGGPPTTDPRLSFLDGVGRLIARPWLFWSLVAVWSVAAWIGKSQGVGLVGLVALSLSLLLLAVLKDHATRVARRDKARSRSPNGS